MNARESTVKFLKAHRDDKARLKTLGFAGRGNIGAGCSGRLAAGLQSEAENLALRVGENEVLRRALIYNGRHPSYQNGGILRRDLVGL